MGAKTASKPKKRIKDKLKKRRKTMAELADKHILYEKSVQGPEEDAKFYRKFYRKLIGRHAVTMREDFCGTAILSCEWVKLNKDHRAIGVDLDGPTLESGRERHLSKLKKSQQERIELIQDDVRAVRDPKVDMIVALNFSYSVFKKRADLRDYIQACYDSLNPDGVLILDDWGGSDTQTEVPEEREVEDFTYIWDQDKFDPVSYETVCKIHFEFEDGSRIDDAFVYDWRMWTLPELQELYEEVGFQDVHVLWEGTDPGSDEGNGEFTRVTSGEADDAWIAYVVGRK